MSEADQRCFEKPSFIKRWGMPCLWTVVFIYGAQLTPLFAGPLTECDHCVGIYFKGFLVGPGVIIGHWLTTLVPALAGSSELVRFLLPGIVVSAMIVATATVITASTRGIVGIIWLTFLATLSALNALSLAALIRA